MQHCILYTHESRQLAPGTNNFIVSLLSSLKGVERMSSLSPSIWPAFNHILQTKELDDRQAASNFQILGQRFQSALRGTRGFRGGELEVRIKQNLIEMKHYKNFYKSTKMVVRKLNIASVIFCVLLE